MEEIMRKLDELKDVAETRLNNIEERVKKLETKQISLVVEKKEGLREYIHKAINDYITKATTSANVAIPTEFLYDIWELQKQYGIVRQNATVIPVNATSVKIPKGNTNAQAYWVNENTAITETQASTQWVDVTLKKLASYAEISREVLANASINYIDYLIKMFTNAIAKAEDEAGLVGNGVFTGVLNATGVGTVVMSSTSILDITADDLLSLLDAVHPQSLEKGKFVMHRSIFNTLRKLKDSTGRYILDPETKTIWGYEVLVSEVMPSTADDGANKAFVLFGDLSQIVLLDRQNVEIALSEHYGFARDVVAMKVTELVGIAIPNPQAFAILKTKASGGSGG